MVDFNEILGDFQEMLPGVAKQRGFARPRKFLYEIYEIYLFRIYFNVILGEFSENAPRCCKTKGFCVAPKGS